MVYTHMPLIWDMGLSCITPMGNEWEITRIWMGYDMTNQLLGNLHDLLEKSPFTLGIFPLKPPLEDFPASHDWWRGGRDLTKENIFGMIWECWGLKLGELTMQFPELAKPGNIWLITNQEWWIATINTWDLTSKTDSLTRKVAKRWRWIVSFEVLNYHKTLRSSDSTSHFSNTLGCFPLLLLAGLSHLIGLEPQCLACLLRKWAKGQESKQGCNFLRIF